MKEIKKTIRTFFLLSGLTTFAHGLIASNYMLYLLEADLSQLEANLCNFAFFACVFLFEIPTGLIADIYGRRASTLLSYIVMGISMFFYGFSDSMMGFMIAEAIAAVALTLESGAFDAWIIDELKGLGSKKKIDKLFGDRQIVTAIFGILGTLVGGIAYDFNNNLSWLLAGATMTITFICGTVIMKERFFEKGEKTDGIKEKLNES
jgi:MFS family permease